MAIVLDLLLPVQAHAQERAQKPLDMIPRRAFHCTSLNVLGSEMGCGSWERLGETRAEHDNELVARSQQVVQRMEGRGRAGIRRARISSSETTYRNVRIVSQDILMGW